MSLIYNCSKTYIFKSDRNHLKLKGHTQCYLIFINAVSDSAKSASALTVEDNANTESSLSETALSWHLRCRRQRKYPQHAVSVYPT